MIDGTVRITAIIVPLTTISLKFSLDFVGSDNRWVFKNGNKNQRYFIFGGHWFDFACQVIKRPIQMSSH